MRVAYVNARFRRDFNDGANTHVRQFVSNAVFLGHEIWMDANGAHPLARALPETRIARIRKLRSMDVVYVRLEQRLPRIVRLAAPTRRWLLGNPLFVFEFNALPEYGRYFQFTDRQIRRDIAHFRQVGRHCDLAVCASERMAEHVRDNFGVRRTLLVPSGSDPDLFRPGAPPEPRMSAFVQTFNVVWLGSAFIAWHNIELLVAAAKILNNRGNRRIQFHLLGQGVAALDAASPNVHLHGAEDYERLPGWLGSMDVGLCLYRPGPADYGSPLKLFDYLMSGLCVVATEHPQRREVLGQLQQTDLLIPPDEPEQLADILERLAASPERARELGRKGRELAAARYTWRRSVTDTFAEIEVLLRQQAG